MLSKQQVQHIANLARIGLSEREQEKYGKDLSAILNYIEKLQGANVDGVEPMSHSLSVENVMRADDADQERPERVNKMMEQAPQKEKGYVRTKAIL